MPFLQTLRFLPFLLLLALISPALSQETDNPPAASEQGGEGRWSQDQMERQEYREEMEKIRTEHENLESEHDQLKTQCMNAKGQDRTTCQQKWQDLHQRRDALHERTKTLHNKMEAARVEHQGHLKKHHTQTKPTAAPAQ